MPDLCSSMLDCSLGMCPFVTAVSPIAIAARHHQPQCNKLTKSSRVEPYGEHNDLGHVSYLIYTIIDREQLLEYKVYDTLGDVYDVGLLCGSAVIPHGNAMPHDKNFGVPKLQRSL